MIRVEFLYIEFLVGVEFDFDCGYGFVVVSICGWGLYWERFG